MGALKENPLNFISKIFSKAGDILAGKQIDKASVCLDNGNLDVRFGTSNMEDNFVLKLRLGGDKEQVGKIAICSTNMAAVLENIIFKDGKQPTENLRRED